MPVNIKTVHLEQPHIDVVLRPGEWQRGLRANPAHPGIEDDNAVRNTGEVGQPTVSQLLQQRQWHGVAMHIDGPAVRRPVVQCRNCRQRNRRWAGVRHSFSPRQIAFKFRHSSRTSPMTWSLHSPRHGCAPPPALTGRNIGGKSCPGVGNMELFGQQDGAKPHAATARRGSPSEKWITGRGCGPDELVSDAQVCL